ncbi:cell division protein SepF [Candidatus Woesearchaeota archaeon]|nr:MAG: cell division protein SepF [Candidatus Woesearchaeota archaeon]
MKKFFAGLKKTFTRTDFEDDEEGTPNEDYVELDTEQGDMPTKVIVRPFTMEDFSDIKTIIDALREGNTIALINIRPLKEKDIVELKRAINKLKKTCDAIEGDVAGFSEDMVVAVPNFAQIYKTKGQTKEVSEE